MDTVASINGTPNSPPGKSILVTGAAGFIGANFVLEWLGLDLSSVVSLDKLTYAGNLDNLASVANERVVSGSYRDWVQKNYSNR